MGSSVFSILKRKKMQIFFLFYLIMALPLLTPLAENLSFVQIVGFITINLILFLSAVILSVFCTPRTEKAIYSGIFVISYLPFAIYTSYLLFARVLLQNNSLISLFETNPEESKEFMVHYFDPLIAVGCVAYIFLCFLIIWKMKTNKRLKLKGNQPVFFISLSVLLVILVSPQLSKTVYFINFYKLFANYKVRLYKEEKLLSKRMEQNYEVRNAVQDTVPRTIVVVIGESLTRTHMSLYGYARETNPGLKKIGEGLQVYTDVISPQVHTIPVMRAVLTLADKDHPDYITSKPSMFELFNRAGYDTFFITNQPFGGNFSTSYDALLQLADNTSDLSGEKQTDEIVLSVLKDIVEEKSSKNKLILIHLIGNHMAYEFRYTLPYKNFENIKDNKIEFTPFRNLEAIHTIDKYDNSVLYNDFIISSIINILKNDKTGNTAMVYFSDHGEEVYDIRNFAGHAYEKVSSHMCEIPFLVWLSSGYLQDRPDIEIDTGRPYSTVDFLYSLSNLAGIDFADYDSKKSIFSGNFVPAERIVGDYPYQKVKDMTININHP